MHSSSSLNKLQAKKSSFQAWKCASFGFALFALILLVSKWHEVSTDYNLLTNIDHLIWAQNQARLSAPANASAQSTRVAVSQQTTPPAFPQQNGPASLWAGTTLGGQNKSVSSEEGAQNNQAVSSKETPLQTTDTDQHLQLLLGREQNGNELLRRELESFLGKSSLSSGAKRERGQKTVDTRKFTGDLLVVQRDSFCFEKKEKKLRIIPSPRPLGGRNGLMKTWNNLDTFQNYTHNSTQHRRVQERQVDSVPELIACVCLHCQLDPDDFGCK